MCRVVLSGSHRCHPASRSTSIRRSSRSDNNCESASETVSDRNRPKGRGVAAGGNPRPRRLRGHIGLPGKALLKPCPQEPSRALPLATIPQEPAYPPVTKSRLEASSLVSTKSPGRILVESRH